MVRFHPGAPKWLQRSEAIGGSRIAQRNDESLTRRLTITQAPAPQPQKPYNPSYAAS